MTQAQTFTFIQYDVINNIVSLFTNSKADAGVFTITITGSIFGVYYQHSASTKITLTVMSANCETTSEKI